MPLIIKNQNKEDMSFVTIFFPFINTEFRRINILENNFKSKGKIDSGTVQSFHSCETILNISYLSKMSLDNKLLVCNQIWDHN